MNLYVVYKERTVEGETYIKTIAVPLRDPPPVISGTFNIVADVLPNTSLFDIVCHAQEARDRDSKKGPDPHEAKDRTGSESDIVAQAIAARRKNDGSDSSLSFHASREKKRSVPIQRKRRRRSQEPRLRRKMENMIGTTEETFPC